MGTAGGRGASGTEKKQVTEPEKNPPPAVTHICSSALACLR